MKRWPGLKILGAMGFVCLLSAASLPSIELGGLTLVGNLAHAQTADIKLAGCKAPPERRRLSSLSQSFFKRVAEVDNLTNPPEDRSGNAPEPNYTAAWPRLQRLMDGCEDCNQYELAQLYQRAAFIQYNLDNLPQAIEYFKRVVGQSPHIPEALETQLLYQIAQLSTSVEQYKEALDYFGRWEAMCPSTVPDDYFYYRAQIFYQLNERDRALTEVERSINIVEGRGEVAREPWLRLQMAILVDKENYPAAEKAAEKLAVNYTNARVVAQLASLYGMNGKETRQLALMDALHQAGALERENEFRNLAFMFMSQETPFLASKVMSAGVNSEAVPRTAQNLEVWAVSLTQAQESSKAIPIMEEAAKKSDTGRLHATLAAIYLDAEDFKKTISAAQEALRKGGLRSDGEVHMYMGSAYMYMEQFDESIAALQKASKDEKYTKYATDLMKYVKTEKNRQETLKRAAAEEDKAAAVDQEAL